MNFPTSYDSKLTTFGDLKDLIVLSLAAACDAVTASLTFSETDLVDSLVVNTPLVFADEVDGDFEIVLIEEKGAAGSGTLTVQRGYTSTAIAHSEGAVAVQEPIAATYKTLKDLALVAQKFKGLVGTSLPAACEPGEVFLKTDTQQVYVCFIADNWTLVTRPQHASYSGLDAANAHSIYLTLAQAQAFHDALLGGHLTDAATHDHAGTPVRHFRTGLLADLPAAQNAGDVYFASDVKALYFSADGATWIRYSTVPRGTVMMFAGACPAGWERVTAMDDRMPRGAATDVWSGLQQGGAATHQHTMNDLISHTHTIPAQSGAVTTSGGHTHKVPFWGGSGGEYSPYTIGGVTTTSLYSSDAGSHTHSISFPGTTTQNANSSAPKTAEQTSYPAYRTMTFCRKQ